MLNIQEYGFIKVRCYGEDTASIIAFRKESLERARRIIEDYKSRYESGEIECSLEKYLDIFTIEYKNISSNPDLVLDM